VATPEEQIPPKHLPLDILQRLIARREAEARDHEPVDTATEPEGEVDRLLASVGLRTQAPAVDVEPLRAEVARRLNEGRERARVRAALYRSHLRLGLLQYRARPSRRGLEKFVSEAGRQLRRATGVPPLYLLVPARIYRNQLPAIYNVYGAAIRGHPVVLATEFGPLKVLESDLVDEITLV
jgi:hypothetical protein